MEVIGLIITLCPAIYVERYLMETISLMVKG